MIRPTNRSGLRSILLTELTEGPLCRFAIQSDQGRMNSPSPLLSCWLAPDRSTFDPVLRASVPFVKSVGVSVSFISASGLRCDLGFFENARASGSEALESTGATESGTPCSSHRHLILKGGIDRLSLLLLNQFHQRRMRLRTFSRMDVVTSCHIPSFAGLESTEVAAAHRNARLLLQQPAMASPDPAVAQRSSVQSTASCS